MAGKNSGEFKTGLVGGFSLGIVTWFVWYETAILTHTTEKLYCLPLAMGEWFLPTFWVYSKLKTERERFGFLIGQFCSLIILGALGLFYIGVTNYSP